MIEVDKNESAIFFIGGEQNGTWNNKTWISITSLRIFKCNDSLKVCCNRTYPCIEIMYNGNV